MNSDFNDFSLTEYLNILELEFDNFKNISSCPKGTEDFFRIFSDIEDLCLKEEKYIDRLPQNVAFLSDLSVSAHNFYNNVDIEKRYFVLMRLDNTLEVLKAKVEDENICDDILNDEFYDSYDLFNKSRERLIREFISSTSSEFGYLAAFSIKEISDELIANNFELDGLHLNDVNQNNYYDNLSDEVQSKIMDLIVGSEFNEDSLIRNFNIEIFKFMLSKLRNFDFQMIKDTIENEKIYLNNVSYLEIINMFKQAEKDRNNHVCHNVNIDVFDRLVNLIKLEEVLFKKYDSLNVCDSSSLKSISSLLQYEKEIIDDLNIDEYDCDILYDVISSDIHFFLVSNYSPYINKVITRRIINLLPIFQKDVASGTFRKSYNEVIKNHIINSLSEYKKVICDVPEDRDALKYVQVYKNIIFEYPDLLNDVIVLNYDFSVLFSFDDETNSLMLGFKNPIDYYYDKDNQLYMLAKTVIKEISNILTEMEDNPELVALYEFKICEFNDIIISVSTEHLYSLYDEIEDINNRDIKKILLRKIDFVHKY